MRKRTKIVCTLGPASGTEDIIEKMVDAGMNVARLNFSHGSHEDHARLIERIRSVAEKTGEPIAIMQDVQGPKIRLGKLPKEGVAIQPGETVLFDTARDTYEDGIIPIDYEKLHTFLKKGERILIDDGRIEVSITAVKKTRITTTVVVGGTLFSNKGFNIPDSKLTVRALTEKDKIDVRFGVEKQVDLIALSFVTSASDVMDLRYLIKKYEQDSGIHSEQPIRIIAKIERYEAVKHLDTILDAADGIMVARGDLGVEMPPEEVPLIQKRLIDRALAAAKPVIVATQMLDSMQHNPRPTRAEVSDVSNAVIDHTDAVMLSNETATGMYPVETVQMMSDIIHQTESSSYHSLIIPDYTQKNDNVEDVISQASRLLGEKVGATLILVASLSGDTARLISRYRPELPIVVATSTKRVMNQLHLSWGVRPFLLPECQTIEELVERSMLYMKQEKIVKSKNRIIVVAGEPVGHAGYVNLLEVREVE